MPGFVKRVDSKARLKTRSRPRPKIDTKARAEAFYGNLHVLADKKEALVPPTAAEIEKILISNSYKQYTYNIRLWRR